MIFSLIYRNYFIKALFFTFLSLECSFLFVIVLILTVYLLSSSTLDCFGFFLRISVERLVYFSMRFKYRSQNIQCKRIEMLLQKDCLIPDGVS